MLQIIILLIKILLENLIKHVELILEYLLQTINKNHKSYEKNIYIFHPID